MKKVTDPHLFPPAAIQTVIGSKWEVKENSALNKF